MISAKFLIMYIRFLTVVLILFHFPLLSISIQERINAVLNPRLTNDWVSDGVGYLNDSGASKELNSIIGLLEHETSAEIAVVTLASIGDENPKEFATLLFEKWGVGKKGKDNGVLLLHVLDQRRLEIETGYGSEAVLPDVLCKRILDSIIIEHFKKGEFSFGIVAGVKSITHSLRFPNHSIEEKLSPEISPNQYIDLPMEHYLEVASPAETTVSPSAFEHGILMRIIFSPIESIKEFFFFWISFTIMVSWFSLGSIFAILPFGNHVLYNIYAYFGRWISWLAGISSVFIMFGLEVNESETAFSLLNLLPIVISLFYINNWIGKKLRNNPRVCPKCHTKMEKLSEKADDAYLDKGELTEEKISSLDYDIWKCQSCNEIKKERYSGNSPASKCRKCRYYTFRHIDTRVIRSATYDHGGEEIRNYKCEHCGLTEARRVTTAQLQKPSSSSYSRSSGSSGSSYSSGGSSGSWGGGSSGGGGAGSSY